MSDSIYRTAVQFTKFFSKGWGSPMLYEKLFDLQSRAATDNHVFSSEVFEPSRNVEVRITSRSKDDTLHILDGEFLSPFCKMCPGALPHESETASFQMVLPTKWKKNHRKRPVVIHYGGTGDHYFWRRRMFMASPLAKEHGIGSIILENPFYGVRKPKDQVRSGLNHVIDLFSMGGALMVETIALLSWCEKQGLGPFGLSGISMGGHMASVCATAVPSPIAIIPCLSWSTAGPVFSRGVMSKSVAWSVLKEQLETTQGYEGIMERFCKSYMSLHPLPYVTPNHQGIRAITNRSTPESERDIYSRQLDRSDRTSAIKSAENSGLMASGFGSKLVYESRKEYVNGKQKFNVFTLDTNFVASIEATYNSVLNFLQDKINFDLYRETMTVLEHERKLGCPRTVYYLDAFMDCATHLRHFRKPHPNSKTVYVIASHDQYVPRDKEMSPAQIWPNVSIRYIDSGHVMGVLRYQQVFRDAINDALTDLIN